MKKSISIFCLLAVAFAAHTQEAIIKIAGTRLAYPVMQKWIKEYSVVKPEVKIKIDGKASQDSVDILIAAHMLDETDLGEDKSGIAINRYVQLPVVNRYHKDLAALQTKGFSEKDFRKIYFSGVAESNAADGQSQLVVYKREKQACASRAFANHFGNQQKDINGIGIKGDDRDMLDSVKRNAAAVSYNNLGFIYDLTTRKVVDSIAVIPVDLDNNGTIDKSEKIYNTVDNVIAFTEKTGNPSIPVENVNVVFRKTNRDVVAFLDWILTHGQQFNHAYGFLNLDPATIESEKKQIASSGFHSCTPAGRQLIKNTLTASK